MATSTRLAILPLSAVLLLAGCTLLPTTTPSPTSSQPSVTASPDPTETATEEPSAASTPVTIECSSLVSDQVIYDWGSGNWGLDPDVAVPSDSNVERVNDFDGAVCGWVNLSSGDKLTVAVANLSPATLAEVKQEVAASGTPTSSFGGEGYFSAAGGVGEADVFTGSYWIVASSAVFLEPADVKPLVAAAVSAVG
jgi:hypothetical protein